MLGPDLSLARRVRDQKAHLRAPHPLNSGGLGQI
jgi:hypothetical protein